MKYLCTQQEFHDALVGAGSKLVVVDFTASWCGPCQHIAPRFEEFSKNYTDLAFFKVDVDENSEVAEEQQVEKMPTFIFYKNSKEVDRFIGANANQLEEFIKNLLGKETD